MRTIKFRVWDNELKKYRSAKDGDYSLGVLSGKVRGIYGEKFPQMEVQQFTGLHDKNGKEIYEGDIVSFEDDPADIVKWCEDFAGWAFDTLNKLQPDEFLEWGALRKYHEKHYIIIGNIFENPELVKL